MEITSEKRHTGLQAEKIFQQELVSGLSWHKMGEFEHYVQFYEADDFLLVPLGEFIGTGLDAGDACIVVATKEHRKLLEEQMEVSGRDLAAARTNHQYISLDASEVLLQLMVDGLPDPERFYKVIGNMVRRAAEGQRHVRIFGEMVALLWMVGNQKAALRLEALWNDLSHTAPPFSLFCAYPMHYFAGEAFAVPFTEICNQHSRVIPDQSYFLSPGSDESQRAIAQLRQKAASLEAEIAERKAAEEARLYLAAIVESSDDAILSKDLNGTITSWNAAAERMYGYSAQEMIGQSVTRLFPPDHPDEFQQIMERICRGEHVDHYETRRICKDGSSLIVSVTISPIKNSSGTIIGASAIARDISAYKELEQQREAFISIVTHELKNPLTALQGNVQLARRWLTRLLNTDLLSEQQQTVKEVLVRLNRSQQQLRVQHRLINDLLDVSHIQAGTLELCQAPCDLVALVDETVQDYQAAHPDRQITLDLPEQDSLQIEADADRLRQVLGNYLTNALKFSPSSEPVHVGLSPGAGKVRVWVTDHGPGLSREQQQHIWKRFYKSPQTPIQNGAQGGLGLGLYICQRLISQQQGKVGVKSTPGSGTTFWFTLPLLSSSPHPGYSQIAAS